MKSGMKVDIISRKAIKPASLTPPHLRTFTLSFLDQHTPPSYGNLVFFYLPPTENNCNIISTISERSRLLQKSLSETLVHFYPMAGQQKNNVSIDCNDEGAYFVEARINCKIVDFLRQPDLELLNCFIPANDPKTIELALDSILIVQLSIFDCGGMVIAVCISHKIADASSDYAFIRHWSAMTHQNSKNIVLPKFIGASLLPPRDLPLSPIPTNSILEKCITRRLVFDGTNIASLKSKFGNAMGNYLPTNVEIVSAFIVRCAIGASQLKSGSFKPSLLFQAVNLRNRMMPPLSENTIGNLVCSFEVVVKESEIELHEIVAKMRKGLTDFLDEKATKLFKGDEGYEMILKSLKQREILRKICINNYWCTSLCKIPLYEIDFGWGKPIWAISRFHFKNVILLMDTKYGGGIEAWVTLEEKEMDIFERNKELHTFASFNSSLLPNIAPSEKAGNSRL